MLPDTSYYQEDEEAFGITAEASQPSLTYRFDFETGRISGKIDGDEALEQALKMILITPAMTYDLYSFYYGLDYTDLVGEDLILAQAEMEGIIKEAVLYDDRFVDVGNFSYDLRGNDIHVRFTVTTITGTTIDEEVEVNV